MPIILSHSITVIYSKKYITTVDQMRVHTVQQELMIGDTFWSKEHIIIILQTIHET